MPVSALSEFAGLEAGQTEVSAESLLHLPHPTEAPLSDAVDESICPNVISGIGFYRHVAGCYAAPAKRLSAGVPRKRSGRVADLAQLYESSSTVTRWSALTSSFALTLYHLTRR